MKRPRSTRSLLKAADKAIASSITLAEALRLEAKGLGRVFFEQGVGKWFPLSEKAQ